MKKALMVITLAMITIAGFSQGFFKPVDKNLFNKDRAIKSDVWLIRPAISITAVQLNWNKTTKSFDASALNQVGLGAGYQHFIEVNGVPFNNFGFNALLLLGADIGETQPATMSIALTGSLFNYVNLGALYSITNKTFGLLTGVTLKF